MKLTKKGHSLPCFLAFELLMGEEMTHGTAVTRIDKSESKIPHVGTPAEVQEH